MRALFALSRKSGLGLMMLVASALATSSMPARAQFYQQHNLVSDLNGLAPTFDPNLINPWGVVFPPHGPFWISDNNAGATTLYDGSGNPISLGCSPAIMIPPPSGASGSGTPTGIVFNGTSDFVVSENSASAPARFLFATEDGTLAGWSPGVDLCNAILAADNSAPGGADGSTLGAVYKGLANGNNGSGNFIYATNFRDGVVEMYDGTFTFIKSFTDPGITPDAADPGFAPFGIRNINGSLYVTFAMQDSERHDDVAGLGSGFVDVFDLNGNFVQRFATGGTLNSPWGLALAPDHFGKFSGDLLVGNFGDGRINGFKLQGHSFVGQLRGNLGQPVAIDGLWGLTFGNGNVAGQTNELFFTAGLFGESHGLFGRIIAAGVANH